MKKENGPANSVSEKECYSKILNTMQKSKLIADRSIGTARRLSVQKAQQSSFQNTKKLLKNLRDIRWAVVTHVLALTGRKGEALAEGGMKKITAYLNHEKSVMEKDKYLAGDDLRLLSEIKALRRSADLLALIEEYIGEISKKGSDGAQYARIMCYQYIDDDVPEFPVFLQMEGISQSTYYRYLSYAVGMLSDLLWGVPEGGKLSALVDVAVVVAEIRPEYHKRNDSDSSQDAVTNTTKDDSKAS